MDIVGVTSLLPDDLESKDIYRILSFDHLAEWFETQKFALLSPSKWEDPFEKYLMEKIFPDEGNLRYQKGRMYGLCFSKVGISDALWKIYSPNQLGIRIKTSPLLLANAISTAPALAVGRTYIGSVNYFSTNKITNEAKALKSRIETKLETQDVAKIMLLKRNAFSHEKEIRIIHLTYNIGPRVEVLPFDIDPHTAIKSIVIDPRATEQRVKALTKYFRELCGYKGSIAQSTLYQIPNF
ncbi:DUF2971 domain-containing protein [Geobacter pickeringii]|uniref:DUF2971 domain-containing protein n=1 Tax=Geobacter pickeringii TaxID=345632 RepID=UPI0011848D9E|nr:DUF2971 domain-containing protein [Geobacter pickeringii]